MIALSLADIGTADPVAYMLVEPVIRGRKTVEVQPGRVDGVAVVLECDDERARAIVDVLRMKYPKWRMRAWERVDGAWKPYSPTLAHIGHPVSEATGCADQSTDGFTKKGR